MNMEGWIMRSLETVMKKAFTAKVREEIRRSAKEKAARIKLQQLREARDVSQEEVARTMGISQAALSRLEHRTNITIGTLQRYIEALGGQLEVRAVFGKRKEEIVA
jgi:DNA-binding Xre family transcriptional regulator